jgi:TrpR-related protein YerC/YecD
MNEKLKNDKSIEMLFRGILELENIEQCYKFFSDLCTIHELKALAQRLEVSGLLIDGETYSVIGTKTGASTATISRVNRCLNYGEGGYELVQKRIKKFDTTEGETLPSGND